MSKDLLRPGDLGELDSFTLSDLLRDKEAEILKKGSVLKVRKRVDDHLVTLEVRSYPDGMSLSQSSFKNNGKKKKLAGTVKAMRAEGKTQQEIAYNLGISQSYVVKLLKNKED